MEALDKSQQIEVSQNSLEDSLGRNFHLSNPKITYIFHSACPFLTQHNWELIPLMGSIFLLVVSMGGGRFQTTVVGKG